MWNTSAKNANKKSADEDKEHTHTSNKLSN